MKHTIAASLVLAILASLFTVTVAAAWHVDTACETIKYDGYTYKIGSSGEWTKSDTTVAPGTHKVYFTNGEKHTYTVEPCPRVDIRVRGMVCGDPRIFVKATNKGNVTLPTRLRFKFGSKAFSDIRYANLTTSSTRKAGPRWARGTFWVEVKDQGQWHRIVTRTIGKSIQPRAWGEKGCPSGLKAGKDKVDFRKAQFTGRYER